MIVLQRNSYSLGILNIEAPVWALFFNLASPNKDTGMKVNEVPQDARDFRDGDKVKKLVYAVDKDGKYTGVNSAGWEAENTATRQAWDAVDEALAETEAKVKAGQRALARSSGKIVATSSSTGSLMLYTPCSLPKATRLCALKWKRKASGR